MTFNMQYFKYFILILTIFDTQMNLKQLAVPPLAGDACLKTHKTTQLVAAFT